MEANLVCCSSVVLGMGNSCDLAYLARVLALIAGLLCVISGGISLFFCATNCDGHNGFSNIFKYILLHLPLRCGWGNSTSMCIISSIYTICVGIVIFGVEQPLHLVLFSSLLFSSFVCL